MPESVATFTCEGCKRSYAWKPEIAGKSVRCKCGFKMKVPMEQPGAAPAMPPPPTPQPRAEPEPQPAASEPAEDDLYALSDLANAEARARASAPPVVVPVAAGVAAPMAEEQETPEPVPRRKKARRLNYMGGPTQQEQALASRENPFDTKRDLFAPLIILGAGAMLYLLHFAVLYHVGMIGLLFVSIGMIIMTIIETALLMGFALVISSPLGVSFGHPLPALLKFAAVVALTDGIIAWVMAIIDKLAPGMGGFGGMGISGIVSIAAYWLLITYLFEMDSQDSWLVVVILYVFTLILRIVVVIFLLSTFLSWGGVHINVPTFGGSSGVVSEMDDHVDKAKNLGLLEEAKQYADKYGRTAEKPTITGWYDAGAPNVWVEVTRDINGHGTPYQMIVELPKDKTARAKCFQLGNTYYSNNGMGSPLVDNGTDNYIFCPLP